MQLTSESSGEHTRMHTNQEVLGSIMNWEADMSLVEQIVQQVSSLPPEKQSEVLDFITFLQQCAGQFHAPHQLSLKQHPAFGAWKHRDLDAIGYQHRLRAEWDPSS
jgi:hypothetical protein